MLDASSSHLSIFDERVLKESDGLIRQCNDYTEELNDYGYIMSDEALSHDSTFAPSYSCR